VPYPLLDLPFPAYCLNGGYHSLTSEAEAQTYQAWLAETEPRRVPVVLRFLASAGAPVPDPTAPERDLPALEAWLKAWFPVMYERWHGTHWGYGPFGRVVGGGGPGYRTYSLLAATVETSVAHDVAFLVVAAARLRRSDLRWAMEWESLVPPRGKATRGRRGYYDRAMGRPGLDPVQYAGMVVRRSVFTREVLDKMAAIRPLETLVDLYQELLAAQDLGALSEPAPVPEAEVGDQAPPAPDPATFASPYYPLREQEPGAPLPAPHLVRIVSAFRACGWFAWAGARTDTELAGALAATWEAVEEEPLATSDGELDWQLVVLDGRRTLWTDIEAGTVQEAIGYRALLQTLADLSGDALTVRRVREDWDAVPDWVVLTATTSAGRRTVRLPDGLDMIDPGLVLAVNRWLRPTGVQFYFLDTGGQMAIVTRATEAERQALQAARPIRLDTTPPPWWLAVRDQ